MRQQVTRPLDDIDNATIATLRAKADRDRQTFGWIAVVCLAVAGLAGAAASGSRGKAANAWTSIAACTGGLAGLAGLAWFGSRSKGLDRDVAAGTKEIWAGQVVQLRRAGYRGSLYSIEVDGRSFSLSSDRRMPVEAGDHCEIHAGMATGQVLRIERVAEGEGHS